MSENIKEKPPAKEQREVDRIMPALLAAGFLVAFLPALLLPVPGSMPEAALAADTPASTHGHYEVVWVED